MERAEIALVMIVRDERAVIERALRSALPLVSCWCIVDTGSTDGTQDIVHEVMGKLPGVLPQRPWRGFAASRNEALELARPFAPYALMLDADDVIVLPEGFALPVLTRDRYDIELQLGDQCYWRPQLFRNDGRRAYEGSPHEVLVDKPPTTSARLAGLTIRAGVEGSRSRNPRKYELDAAALAETCKRDPSDTRAAFYFAQSLKDAATMREAAGELAESRALLRRARDAFARRVALGGNEEEAWLAMLWHAGVSAALNESAELLVEAYLRVYERRPGRAEPLCYLAQWLRKADRVLSALPFACTATTIPYPTGENLLVDKSVYTWRSIDEAAVALYWAGAFERAAELNWRLLSEGHLPDAERERVEKNLACCRTELGPKATIPPERG